MNVPIGIIWVCVNLSNRAKLIDIKSSLVINTFLKNSGFSVHQFFSICPGEVCLNAR